MHQFEDDIFGLGDKQIMDPVHGGFRVYKHELQIIDKPLFQRLRFIKQNDVASLVFPGALHNRFQHSMGVMHIAGRVYRSVIMNHLKWTKNVRGTPITSDISASIIYLYYCFRLAALMHDTGHFPFSHEFENSQKVGDLFKDTSIINSVGSRTKQINEHISHEHYSLICANSLLSESKNIPVEKDDVLCLMENSSYQYTEKFKRHAKNVVSVTFMPPISEFSENDSGEALKAFLSNLISGEFDVDKMDYLLRDSYFTGVSYGQYNADHLISTLRIGISDKPKWSGIAILDKGIGALENFIFSRFQLYCNVWSHKALDAGKLLLRKALNEVFEDESVVNIVKNCLIDTDEFMYFTDDFFWEEFRKKARSDKNSFCAKLLQRHLPKHLETLRSPTDFEIEAKKIQLENEYPGDSIELYKTNIKFSKIRQSTFNEMKMLERKINSKETEVSYVLREIRSASDFFTKFEDTGRAHFYKTESLGLDVNSNLHSDNLRINLQCASSEKIHSQPPDGATSQETPPASDKPSKRRNTTG